ncbi:MAG: hypothetical protein WC582_04905 [Patescibacteria group bacterium]
MSFERPTRIKEEQPQEESHLFDGISTPHLDTNNPGTGLHMEAHAKGMKKIDDTLAEETRDEIINHYNIDNERVVIFPTAEGKKRNIRAFIIVEKKETDENSAEKNKKYYADGHAAHADLIKELCRKFPEMGGLEDNVKIPDSFLKEWVTKKGFIDPNSNGFKGFPEIRFAFEKLIIEKNEDKITADEREKVENDSIDLPNWFVVGGRNF